MNLKRIEVIIILLICIVIAYIYFSLWNLWNLEIELETSCTILCSNPDERDHIVRCVNCALTSSELTSMCIDACVHRDFWDILKTRNNVAYAVFATLILGVIYLMTKPLITKWFWYFIIAYTTLWSALAFYMSYIPIFAWEKSRNTHSNICSRFRHSRSI